MRRRLESEEWRQIMGELTLSRYYTVTEIAKRHGITREAIHNKERRAREERFDVRDRRRGDASECPERNWLTPVEFRDGLTGFQGMYRAKKVVYQGVPYRSINAAAKANGVSRDKITGRRKCAG